MLPRQLQHWSAWEPRDHLILVITDRTLSPGAPALHHDFTPKQKFGPDTMGLRLWRSSFLLQLLKKVCVCPVELSSISNARRCVLSYFQATRSNMLNTRDMQCFIGIGKHQRGELKTRRAVEFILRNSKCLDSRWNPVSSVWYIFSIETETEE